MIHGAALLQAADSPGGRLVVDLLGSRNAAHRVNSEVTGSRKAKKLRSSLTKNQLPDKQVISPTQVQLPITGTGARIQWERQQWSTVRAFHYELARDRSLWEAYAPTAAAFTNKIHRPGILAVHTVVLVREPPPGQGQQILLCRKSLDGPPDSYFKGQWSASIEEVVSIDETVQQAVRRAIGQELMGTGIADLLEVRTMALFLETEILNLCVLNCVNLPLTFEELVDRWMWDAPDRAEHDMLIALPLDRNVLDPVINAGVLEEAAIQASTTHSGEMLDPAQRHKLHPTAGLRLAVALWTTGADAA